MQTYTFDPRLDVAQNIRRLRKTMSGWVVIVGHGWKAKCWFEPTKATMSAQRFEGNNVFASSPCYMKQKDFIQWLEEAIAKDGL